MATQLLPATGSSWVEGAFSSGVTLVWAQTLKRTTITSNTSVLTAIFHDSLGIFIGQILFPSSNQLSQNTKETRSFLTEGKSSAGPILSRSTNYWGKGHCSLYAISVMPAVLKTEIYGLASFYHRPDVFFSPFNSHSSEVSMYKT